jgi:hypothetical protein
VKAKNATYDSAATLNNTDRTIYESLRPRDHAAINDSGVICGPWGQMPSTNFGASTRAYLLLPLAP